MPTSLGTADGSRASLRWTLKRGLRLLLAHKKAILLAYALNLALAVVVVAPFASSFEKSLGGGLYRTSMVERIDYDWYSLVQDGGDQLLASFSPAVTGFGPFLRNLDGLVLGRLDRLPPLLVAVGLLYILLNTFLSAAAFGSFAKDPKGLSFRDFHRRGGEFFGRFLRLTLLSLLSFAILSAWIMEPVRDLTDRITDGVSVDRSVFQWDLATFLVLLFLLSILNMVFDYAKIVTTTEDRSSVFLSLLSASTFCVTYAAPVYVLHLSIAALGVVWILCWVTLEQWVPQTAWAGVLFAIGLQQICFIGRLAFRFYFYSTQMEFFLENELLYRGESPDPTTQPAPDSKPLTASNV